MTRYASMDVLRKAISPDVVVIDDIAPAELVALGCAGDLGAPAEMAQEGVHGGIVAQSIVLPYPVSANRYWRNYDGRTVVSEEARDYKAAVKLRAQLQRLTPFAGPVAVYMHVYRPQARGDLDNAHKVTLDALCGALYNDDAQIVELHSWRHDDRNNPRVEVEVRRVGE